MKKYEYYDRHGFFHTWRIVPAFMCDGVRVFHKEEYKEEIWSFNEKVFPCEDEAEKAILKILNNLLRINYINSYTVKDVG